MLRTTGLAPPANSLRQLFVRHSLTRATIRRMRDSLFPGCTPLRRLAWLWALQLAVIFGPLSLSCLRMPVSRLVTIDTTLWIRLPAIFLHICPSTSCAQQTFASGDCCACGSVQIACTPSRTYFPPRPPKIPRPERHSHTCMAARANVADSLAHRHV